jgi:hypothetical protein
MIITYLNTYLGDLLVVRNSVDSETMDFVLFLTGSLDYWIFSMLYSGNPDFKPF